MKQKLALLALGALVLATVPATTAFGQTATYTVPMGGDVPHGFTVRPLAPLDHGVPTVNVMTGDVVDLVGGAILLPEGTGPLEWASENTQELDSPYGFIDSDPDPDLAEPFPSEADYKFNIDLFLPSDPCGATAADACLYDGSEIIVGGDREDVDGRHFYVQVTATPNTTLWAVGINRVSRATALRINVAATDADDPADVEAAGADVLARERDEALALHAKLSKASTKHRTRSGQVIHDAYAGYDTDTFVLFAFYPARLVINKGDKVRWHFAHLLIELHGVGFPFKAGIETANNGFIPVCDPDGDQGTANDTFDVDFETFTCPEASGDLEVDLSSAMTAASGDGRFPGGPKRFEDSGLRGDNVPSAPGLAGGTDPWDLTFTKASSDKGYRYACTFHGRFMNATVVVK